MANVPEQSAAASLAGDLVVQCLEILEREGPDAVEALLERHPSEAEEVRARLRKLSQLGFLLLQGTASRQELPERLGSFRLRERLGAGGMGVVFLAEDEILARSVALKVVRPDLLLIGNARERFRREVEAVARLKHPGILPVYSAGEEGGVPFFTMEYVEGCTLSEVLSHLSRKRPAELSGAVLSAAIAVLSPAVGGGPTKARFGTTWTEACFRLILAVAEALQHAHERGVLHRDIKPSNVMVTRDGRVVLMDFGLASSSESSRITMTGSHVGSLPYMSPEQIRGDAERGAASDVYSLGVTLYELLTLRCPYLAPNAEVTRKRILEGVPPPIRSLNPQVPWDAETVCLTAMDRDPARRYGMAAAFAADLTNFLEHRPIRARRPGPLLRTRRFVERHPVASVAAALGFLLLVGAAGFAAVQLSTNRELRAANREKGTALEDAQSANRALRVANEEKDEALTQAETANAAMETALARKDDINKILRSMIGAPDPWRTDLLNPVARDTKVVEVLDRAAEELESDLELAPEVAADVSALLGETYVNLSMPERGEPLLVRARELYRELRGEDSRESIQVAWHLGGLRYDQRRFGEAIEILEDALTRGERVLPVNDGLARNVLNDLALTHHGLGNLERAEELYRRQLAAVQDSPGEEGALELALVCHNLGSLLGDRGKFEEASELLEKALELRLQHLPPGHARTLASKNGLAVLRMYQERFAEAEQLFVETLEEIERTLGESHERTHATRVNLAWALAELGRFEEAEPYARAAVAAESDFPAGHFVPFMARVRLAQSLLGQGKLLEAAAFSAEAETLAGGAAERHKNASSAVRREILEELAQAEERLLGELDAAHSEHGAVHAETYAKVCELGSVWRAMGKTEDARILFEGALAEWKRAFPEGCAEVTALEQELERCRLAQN